MTGMFHEQDAPKNKLSEAQMAIVEAQLCDMAEVFLPYAITKNGMTLYREIQSNGMKLLS